MELKFRVQMKIQKPVQEVFQAVHDPKKLSAYFTNGGSTGALNEGSVVHWRFADAPGKEMVVPVDVVKMVPDKMIQLQWAASEVSDSGVKAAAYKTTVEFKFEAIGESNTQVTVTEGKWHENADSLQGSYGNCQGWMNMLCCLKAYAEHGINLRKGAF